MSASSDQSNFDSKARAGKNLSVAFFGGSLTWGAQATNPNETSYRALVGKKLSEAYPSAHLRFWDAAIGGTGSQLAAFRLERDVLAHKPDLVFLDFTINDDPYQNPPSASRLAAYESIVRRLVQAGVQVIQMILPSKQDVEADPPERPLDAKHKEIASAYSLSVADAVALAKMSMADGRTTPDQLWDLQDDKTHPGDAGYALYAEAAWKAFEESVAGHKVGHIPEKMLHADTYMTVNRFRLAAASEFPAGWQAGYPHRNAVAFDFVCSRWMDDLVIAGDTAAAMILKVRASDVLLFGEMTKNSGSYTVRIDGGETESYSAKCNDGNMRLVQVIAGDLDPTREHTIEITPALRQNEELRFESVCVAGGEALVSKNAP